MKRMIHSNFLKYIKLLIKEWILWIIIGIELLTAFGHFIFPRFTPPQITYIVIAIVGIIWASYKIYLDVLKRITLEEKLSVPEVKLSFIEGNEYSYRFGSWDDGANGGEIENLKIQGDEKSLLFSPDLPRSLIYIYLRIENIGETPVKILTIDGGIDFRIPFHFMFYTPINSENIKINFPLELDSKQVSIIKLVAPIHPSMPMTAAQIASRTRILREKETKIDAIIDLEFVDPKGKTYNCQEKIKISLVPLCDMYISHWRSIGKTDLEKLAIGG